VAGVPNISWGCLRFTLLYSDAKHSHVGADVDGLALLVFESPGVATRDLSLFHTGLRGGSMVGGQVVKSCPSVFVVMR
jgi:hypothetical protein